VSVKHQILSPPLPRLQHCEVAPLLSHVLQEAPVGPYSGGSCALRREKPGDLGGLIAEVGVRGQSFWVALCVYARA
jgi:hypothetical protein